MDQTSLILLFLVIVTSVFYATYKFLTKNYSHWHNIGIPCALDPIVGFGHVWPLISLKEHIGTFAQKLYNVTNSSMIGFYFVQRPAILVRDPELVKAVLQTNFANFYNNMIQVNEKNNPVLSKNPFMATNLEQWKLSRARAINHFSSKKLRQLFVIVHEVSNKLAAYVERKIEASPNGLYECELKALFSKFTGEIVANAAFAMEGQCFQDHPHKLSFAKLTSTLFEPTLVNGIKLALSFYLPEVANFFNISLLQSRTDKYFRETLKDIIKKRRQSNTIQNDFLQFCLDSNAEDDIDSIIADVLVFYLDVYETSSSSAASLFYFLSTYKKVQEKVRNEIQSSINETNGEISYDTLKSMNYLDQTITESMRMIPALNTLMKVCTKEITLKGSDGLSCDLKLGEPVFISVTGFHSDPQYYPEPDLFDPDRFNPENNRNKFVFLSFGEGPRMCPGMRLAAIMLKLSTASMLTKFSVEYSSKTKEPLEYEPTQLLSRIKGGLWAKFKKLDRK